MKSDLAKVLHKANGTALINHVINVAKGIGSDKIITIVGHQHEAVKAATAHQRVEYALQAEQLGTGHAVLQARSYFDSAVAENVLVLSGDAPLLTQATLRNMLDVHIEKKASITVLTASLENPTGYGRVIRDATDRIVKIVEEKDATDTEKMVREINSGIYIFDSIALFNDLPKVGNNNKQGEYYLPDVLKMQIDAGQTVVPLLTENYRETLGVNTVEQLREVEQVLIERQQ
jgi:UDP-N-acetylglucosamine diphosphorylase/glucosamine-1-phosphate N-acetyltransferase